ncbi:toprim domain-containing protein [Ensifer sp. IC4062]|nr:toprim domain-containing protein [Ensifer sp. IC4062]
MDYSELATLIGAATKADAACPLCGPLCRTPVNRKRKVLRLWRLSDVAISFSCARCEAKGYALDFKGKARSDEERKAWKQKVAEARRAETDERKRKQRVVEWLWQQACPVQGTLGETYFRRHRGITCPLPPSMRFVGASARYPASVLMPFLDAAGRLKGLHLTRLNPDGSKLDKRMLGTDTTGCPLVVAEPQGSSHLAISEGIEDALSLFQAVGVAAWASGSAGRMPALADRIPPWARQVTIVEDDDRPGQNAARELHWRLVRQRRDVVTLSLAEAG